MKIPEWLDPKSRRNSWVFPSTFLALYVILDWNVAWYGGDALFGRILPIAQLHFILFCLSVFVLILVGYYLLRNRKFIHLILYLVFIAFFIRHLLVDRDELVARNKINARNALQVMLISPEREDVYYVDPPLEKKLLSIKNGTRNELVFVGSFPLFHTYRYDVKADGVFMFNVQVSLLRRGNRFMVQRGNNP